MLDEIEWRATPGQSGEIEGFCPELPDSYSRFVIKLTAEKRCWAILPTLTIESTTNRFIFDTRKEAQNFCANFLKDNTKEVIRHQIRQMKNVYNLKTEKPLQYYETLFQDLINQEALVNLKKSRKANLSVAKNSKENFTISTNDNFDFMK